MDILADILHQLGRESEAKVLMRETQAHQIQVYGAAILKLPIPPMFSEPGRLFVAIAKKLWLCSDKRLTTVWM